jgi:hypothetical protein
MAQLRRELGPELKFRASPPQTVVMERGDHTVAVNLSDRPANIKRPKHLAAEARPGDGAGGDVVPAHGAWIARIS